MNKTLSLPVRFSSILTILALLLGTLGVSPVRAAGILHVTPAGTGDCTDWANACSLQTALMNAVSGDEIWVQAGVYKPTTDTDRTATFQLKSGVAVYGGFAGTESARDERDFTVNVTTLSGDLLENDNDIILPDESTRADNSYHVVTGANGAILDGFTVTAGNANGSTEETNQGGGLYNFHSNTIIQNGIFSSNTATSTGGGVYDYESQPELENVTFINNWGGVGGGMFNHTSSPILTDVQFLKNSAYMGGGMRNMYDSSPSLTKVVFSQNSSGVGGGMGNYLNSNPILTDVTFVENTATEWAGLGGGMHNAESSPVLTNVTFDRNIAIYGGGIGNDQSGPVLKNVTFSGNSALSGGGEYDYASSPTIINSTFTGNSATDRGGGIFNPYETTTRIDNTIFWGNTAPNGGPQLLSYAWTISNTVLEGGCPEQLTCTNIITTDPRLGILGDYGGFTQTIPLLAGSSAIDMGNDPDCPETDQRGIARPQGAHCDIGAFEVSKTLFVTPQGTGDCSDWANACSLQTALTNAVSGDEIWVQAGVYKPTLGADRSATFPLKSGVAVYGGFAGTESARDKRDFTVNVTTLNGDLSGNDNDIILPDEPTRADNSYHVVAGASGAILDGFTVTAGNANGDTFPDDSGGGLLDMNSGSKLTNILFLRNTTPMGGGGIFSANSDSILTNVIFRENYAVAGGGMYTYSPSNNLTLTKVTFDSNSSATNGGGMFVGQGNSTLTDVAFIGNTADMGGGLYNESDGLVMNNITFFDNSAVTYGGGMLQSMFGHLSLTNATFAGNSANNGGGLANFAHAVGSTLTNITFNGNTADTNGGGVYNDGYVDVYNAILWGNTDLSGLQAYDKSYSTISDSVIQGECSIYTVCTNIINDDPLLGVLGDYGGFTQTIPVAEGSSAIDATSNNCPVTDQRGVSRSNPACDIGAFELVVGVDTPETIMDDKPSLLDNNNTPTFTFSAVDGSGSGIASFMCRMDGGSYTPCISPFTSATLTDGQHTFEVYAINTLGNADKTPASHTWTVDTIAPQTSILTTPPALDNDNTPTFTFDDDDGSGSGVASFMCKVDGDPFASCTSPLTLPALVDGPHSFEVYAIDLAGNVDISPATYSWNIETTAPTVISIIRVNPSPTNLANVKFTVTFSEPVTGVDSSDFSLMATGGINGATVTDVSESGAVYVVTVNTGTHNVKSADLININTATLEQLDSLPGIGPTTAQKIIDYRTAHGPFQHIEDIINVSGIGPATFEKIKNLITVGGLFLRLDVIDDDTIMDASNNKLGGLGLGNGNFTNGEYYTLTDISVFSDVPSTYWASNFIERLYYSGITGGCSASPMMYCPEASVTRAQMAVFLLVAEHGAGYTPPDATGMVFNDVPVDTSFARWIEQLAAEGITGGCGNGNYCPNAPVTRAQMAVFLLVAEHGTGYTPPAATGVFNDVPADNAFAPWIEQLAAEGITGGCGGGNFCPNTVVTRAQMAVFLVTAFNLP